MAKITRAEVLKLARLSKLELSEEEIDKFTKEFEEILDYFEQLKSVDVEGLDPTYQVTGLKNVKRKDELVNYGVSPQELLKNAPAQQNDQLKVRRVL